MLELAKIEAGRVRVAVEPADLGELCRGAAMMMEPQARKRRVGIELDLRVSPRVETDPRKVQQILLNLLSNAVKYAAPGEDEDRGDGEVIIRLESLVAEPAAVRLSVIDNGSGIPPEDQERIFQKFEQLDASETRSHGGAGLGLAISRELAAMLQGELQLVSHMGLGSMFSLILPVSYDHDRPAMQPGEQRFEGAVSRG
ncbi:MAG: hypothetical protein CMJ31_15040 [Phycisphaerae bacterium]|nr:hypothetical protein [Phycisphaerae bacterium]